MNWLKRLWAWVTFGELVWLRDMDNTLTLAIARVDPWGNKYAERWWPFNIRKVTLLPDGTVDGSYVEYWKSAGAGTKR